MIKIIFKLIFKDKELEGTEWVHMAWDRNWNTVTEFQVLQDAGN
jgi:hypothetical protein